MNYSILCHAGSNSFAQERFTRTFELGPLLLTILVSFLPGTPCDPLAASSHSSGNQAYLPSGETWSHDNWHLAGDKPGGSKMAPHRTTVTCRVP